MRGRIKKGEKEKGEQIILSNLRQNKQCSQSQVRRLMGDNIFPFT
jgi:hypothetical protein